MPMHQSPAHQSLRGFSLIESLILMTVLGILAITLVLSSNNSNNSDNFDLEAWATRIREDIRLTQMLAFSRHQTVTFTVFDNRYVIRDPANTDLALPYDSSHFSIPTSMRIAINGNSTGSIAFDMNGRPSINGSALNTPSASIVLQNGTLSRSLQIFSDTGIVQDL